MHRLLYFILFCIFLPSCEKKKDPAVEAALEKLSIQRVTTRLQEVLKDTTRAMTLEDQYAAITYPCSQALSVIYTDLDMISAGGCIIKIEKRKSLKILKRGEHTVIAEIQDGLNYQKVVYLLANKVTY